MGVDRDEFLTRLAALEDRVNDLQQEDLQPWEQDLQFSKKNIPPAPIEGGGGTGTGGGLTPTDHRALDQLVHLIAEGSFEEYIYTGNRVDAIIVWTSAAMTTKIREELFTYTANLVTTIVTKQYNAAGSVIAGETMTETLSYTGAKLDDITRVLT